MTHMRHEVHNLELTAPELDLIESVLELRVSDLQDSRVHRQKEEKVAHNHTIEVLNSIRGQIEELMPEGYHDNL